MYTKARHNLPPHQIVVLESLVNPTWNPNHGYILEDDKSPHALSFLIWDNDNSPGFTAVFYKDGRHSHEQYFYNDVFEPEQEVA